jgi:hypothetical protein
VLTYPNADYVSFDGGRLASVRLQDASHHQITRGILEGPARCWKHLTADEDVENGNS